MRLLNPTDRRGLNEAVGFVLLSLGLVTWLSLMSYQPLDPSLDTATGFGKPANLIGYAGSYLADPLLQTFGLLAFLFPVLIFGLAWNWLRSTPIQAPGVKTIGAALFLLAASVGLSFGPDWRAMGGAILPGGILGWALAGYLRGALNLTGAIVLTLTCLIVSVYLFSSFTMGTLARWLAPPSAWLAAFVARWRAQMAEQRARSEQKAALRAARRAEQEAANAAASPAAESAPVVVDHDPAPAPAQPIDPEPVMSVQPPPRSRARKEPARPDEIPICPLEDTTPPWEAPGAEARKSAPASLDRAFHPTYKLPSSELLNEAPGRNPYDEQELKEIAVRIKSKFEEFNVLGSVVQINPGPVVTTFEFKPEAGIKYTRITTLTEDLCLGLQAESILIERIPGKPTVGIEVPNSKREVISLRQVLESDEFQNSPSHMTITLGKDINGRIKVASLESMPHLLIAGSTGSGKSVMINSMIMSIMYKATPDEVRLIMIDPKRLELGLYEGIPHLLTPVITDPKKATNALRNAVLEMERRLRLLAEQGVRNIDQYNKKIAKLKDEPRELFPDEDAEPPEELRPLPYILILIDELADLMMLEGHNVEEAVTRLAQMARAVGMHLVLATQRPSVDVITGLIKANFPARISFRVATRVDSRTILDVMGSEHLLGKGDMLFLPPGSSRLVRVHGAFVTENEINRVVDFWKAQAQPEYDQSYLLAPPADDGETPVEEVDGEQDPMYEDAVRIVLEMGKASTSILQRRLKLGYGRAARILDMMQKDGIIGPPDGPRPREVLKRPDWLQEVEMR